MMSGAGAGAGAELGTGGCWLLTPPKLKWMKVDVTRDDDDAHVARANDVPPRFGSTDAHGNLDVPLDFFVSKSGQ